MCILLFVGIMSIMPASAQIYGCRDPKAGNYLATATENDGSCTYGTVNFSPQRLAYLPSEVKETSGLIFWNGLLWTHNDSGGEAALYALDPVTGQLLHKVSLTGCQQNDWEDIALDEEYCYIGDFGNNNGNRTDLRIYKVPLSEIAGDIAAVASTISFYYPDQEDFSSLPQKNDYDAEAITSIGDSLYIFSKNWVNLRTRLYALPKTEGTHEARLIGELATNGMITGADFNAQNRVLVLCGYNLVLQPFVWLLWDFKGADVFSGNKRRINFNLPAHQIEGIVRKDGDDYLMTNEAFETIVNVKSALHNLKISNWIDATNNFPVRTSTARKDLLKNGIKLYPNPSSDRITLEWNRNAGIHLVELYHIDGKSSEVWPDVQHVNQLQIDVSGYSPGIYLVVLTGEYGRYCDRIVIR